VYILLSEPLEGLKTEKALVSDEFLRRNDADWGMERVKGRDNEYPRKCR